MTVKTRRAALLWAAVVLAGAFDACAEEPPPSPIKRQAVAASHQRRGCVVLSTGKRLDGLVWTTRGKPIRIFDRKKSAYRDVKWEEIASIEQAPDEEWLEEEWRWLESGSDAKVFTGRFYRAAKYRTVIRLKSGEKITGDAVAPVYVKAGKKFHRLELHKRFKSPGPVPKKELKPLLYIKKLVLTDREPEKPAEGKGPRVGDYSPSGR